METHYRGLATHRAGRMGAGICALPAKPAIPEGKSGYEPWAIPAYLLLGMAAPADRTFDRTGVRFAVAGVLADGPCGGWIQTEISGRAGAWGDAGCGWLVDGRKRS